MATTASLHAWAPAQAQGAAGKRLLVPTRRSRCVSRCAAGQEGAQSGSTAGGGDGFGASSSETSSSSSSSSSKSSTSAPSASRRGLLAAATVGGLSAWAGRNAASADASIDATFAAAAAPSAAAATVNSGLQLLERQLDQRLSEFTLPNGLHFLVYERHTAPVVSFHIYADVGAYDEVDGQTGLAHLLEHMAFKGTPRIGTLDYRREAPLLDALDEVFYSLQEAGSSREADRLQQQLATLQKQASELSVRNAYGSMVSREGGAGLNAATSHDSTKYYVSLPANKAEWWFALESERFQAPVFRELYSEKAVVGEERRLRVDGNPLGPFSEQFALRSFGNNYRRPVIGFPEDLDRLGRREVQAFFSEHYGPQNLTIAVAGDVKPADIRRLAEQYFGGWAQPAGALPPSRCSGEGPGAGGGEEALASPAVPRDQWEYRARSIAGPALMHAYYRPCINHPDSVPLDMASDLLSSTRSSRFYQSLILSGKALSATSYASYPAQKHPTQFVCYGVPGKGSSIDELDGMISAELAALAGEGPSEQELRRYKKAARVELLDALGSNSAVSAALAGYQALTGDWRNVLTDLQRIEELSTGDVRDATGRWLRPDNLFKGVVLPGGLLG